MIQLRLSKFNRHRRIFSKDQRGVTVIEFALLAPVFLTLLLSIFELGYMFSKITLLDYAISRSAKQIYIGAATEGTVTYDQIEQQICDDLILGGDACVGNLHLELTPVTSFSDLPDTDAECQDSSVPINPPTVFDPGGSASIVFLRVCFLTDILVPGLGFGLRMTKTDTNKFAIIASTAFVNEPF